MSQGLMLEALATERIRDHEREVAKMQLGRKARRPRRPAGSWVLSGSLATWLR
jgi:hypothetical protein